MSASVRRSFERLQGKSALAPAAKPAFSVRLVATPGVQRFDYPAFIDQICSAICSAWATWQASATLVGVNINGVTAMGGKVVGLPWEPLILAKSPLVPPGLKLSQSVAGGLGGAWLQLTASMAVPGIPWYPAFAAMPMPVAPPTPNVPSPVAILTTAESVVSKAALKAAIFAKHPEASIIDKNLYEAVAEAFEQTFQVWKVSTMITNVLGSGPVPTFAPPYVPVGPVVGGTGVMTPGGFV
jgi:hypothetical protein